MLALPPTLGRPSRRVSDHVLRLFEYACAMRDLRTAVMLLAVLDDLRTRRVSRFGGDRRSSKHAFTAASALMDRARANLNDRGGIASDRLIEPAADGSSDLDRRMWDQVLRTFEYACAMRDMRTARMLLGLLEQVHARQARHVGGDRRQSDGELDAATARLERTMTELADQGEMTPERGDHFWPGTCVDA